MDVALPRPPRPRPAPPTVGGHWRHIGAPRSRLTASPASPLRSPRGGVPPWLRVQFPLLIGPRVGARSRALVSLHPFPDSAPCSPARVLPERIRGPSFPSCMAPRGAGAPPLSDPPLRPPMALGRPRSPGCALCCWDQGSGRAGGVAVPRAYSWGGSRAQGQPSRPAHPGLLSCRVSLSRGRDGQCPQGFPSLHPIQAHGGDARGSCQFRLPRRGSWGAGSSLSFAVCSRHLLGC